MTTTILLPPHNTLFEDPEIYNRTVTSMSRNLEGYLHGFTSDEAPEPNRHHEQDPGHELQEQKSPHVWSPLPLPDRPPTNAQSAFSSDAIISTSPRPPPAIMDPAAFSNLMFTPMNSATRAHDTTATICPYQTHFDPNISPSTTSESEQSRRDSVYSKEEDMKRVVRPPTKGRKRTLEHVEPGSMRAIYLEKNRQAASKCRRKQKVEQETLVEKSREFEAANRMLRAEKQMLLNEVQELKALLGQHVGCPDQRIARWLQMEADRLATSPRYRQ